MNRRRALIMVQKIVQKNNYVAGTYTKGTSTFIVDENGDITISSFGSGASNAIEIPFLHAISIKTNDTVRILLTKKSGTLGGGATGLTVGVYDANDNNLTVVSGASVGQTTNIVDKTATANTDLSASKIRFQVSSNRTFTDFKFTAQIFINGTQVVPEL